MPMLTNLRQQLRDSTQRISNHARAMTARINALWQRMKPTFTATLQWLHSVTQHIRNHERGMNTTRISAPKKIKLRLHALDESLGAYIRKAWENVLEIIAGVVFFNTLVVTWLVAEQMPQDCTGDLYHICYKLGVEDKATALRHLGFVMAGALSLAGIVIAGKRAQAMADAVKATTAGQQQERFRDAIAHLGHEKASVRQGGAHALFHLALDEKRLRASIAEILCAHIRETTQRKDYQEEYKGKPSTEIQSLMQLLFAKKEQNEENKRLDLFWKDVEPNLVGCYFQGLELTNAEFKKANLRKAKFQRSVLDGAQFQKAQLGGAQFQGSCLKEAQFQYAKLIKTNFSAAKVEGAKFEETCPESAQFQRTCLAKANFNRAQARDALFHRATLTAAEFCEAKAERAQFQKAELEGADFCEAKLTSAQFQKAAMDSAEFKKAEAREANFQRAILSKTQFQGAVLHFAKFQNARITDGQFQRADLWEAQFQNAKLGSAKFHRAKLEQTNFRGAQLNRAQFQAAWLDGAQFQAAWLNCAQFQGAKFGETEFQGAYSCSEREGSGYEHLIRQRIGKLAELKTVVFSEGLDRGGVVMEDSDLDEEESKRPEKLNDEHVGKPKSDTLPEGVITIAYSRQDAEKWIDEYKAAMGELPDS